MNLPTTIETALVFLKKAKCPEDVFGVDISLVRGIFRELAMLVHEDKAPENQKKIANEAFILLTKWYDAGNDKVSRGTFGDKKIAVLVTFTTKTNVYNLTELLAENDIAQFYLGENKDGKKILAKVVINPADNDLMKREADILAELPAKVDPKHAHYFPVLLDSFETGGSVRQRVNIFPYTTGAVTLEEVKNKFPNGVPTIHAAWMFNRCLEALHLLHTYGYVHASITPNNLLIVPETHQGILIDFCYAVKIGTKAKIIDANWETWYPKEVFDKVELDDTVDVYMASRLLEYLLGDYKNHHITGILNACRLGKSRRPQKINEIYLDFKKIWRSINGEKKFHVFEMPK